MSEIEGVHYAEINDRLNKMREILKDTTPTLTSERLVDQLELLAGRANSLMDYIEEHTPE